MLGQMGAARRWSTGMSKKPSMAGACRSIVSMRSAPDTAMRLAITLAEIGSRPADLLFLLCIAVIGNTAVIRRADARFKASIIKHSSMMCGRRGSSATGASKRPSRGRSARCECGSPRLRTSRPWRVRARYLGSRAMRPASVGFEFPLKIWSGPSSGVVGNVHCGYSLGVRLLLGALTPWMARAGRPPQSRPSVRRASRLRPRRSCASPRLMARSAWYHFRRTRPPQFGLMFLNTIEVHGDGARPDVHIRADVCVAEIAEVVHLRASTRRRCSLSRRSCP